ncbi:hypothetical protein H6771_02160 [Candidatus Peribacteria bacterium]|nr:hypothetical protein [Candidatus Peribacteria bacterium]
MIALQAQRDGFLLRTTPKTVGIDTPGDLTLHTLLSTVPTPVQDSIALPGEYELSGLLITGIQVDDTVVYRVTSQGMSTVFVPERAVPATMQKSDTLGETIHVLLLRITDESSLPMVKKLVDSVVPQAVVVVTSLSAPALQKILPSQLTLAQSAQCTLSPTDLQEDSTLCTVIPLSTLT